METSVCRTVPTGEPHSLIVVTYSSLHLTSSPRRHHRQQALITGLCLVACSLLSPLNAQS